MSVCVVRMARITLVYGASARTGAGEVELLLEEVYKRRHGRQPEGLIWLRAVRLLRDLLDGIADVREHVGVQVEGTPLPTLTLGERKARTCSKLRNMT